MTTGAAVKMGECTTCGQVPLREDGNCSRCGSRPLMKPASSTSPQPIQTVTLPNTAAVRRWHAATRALREDMAERTKALGRDASAAQSTAEKKARDVQESKRSLSLLNQVLAMIVVPEDPPSGPKSPHPNSINGRWSRAHDACVKCGRTSVRHAARGLCHSCYGKAGTDKPDA